MPVVRHLPWTNSTQRPRRRVFDNGMDLRQRKFAIDHQIDRIQRANASPGTRTGATALRHCSTEPLVKSQSTQGLRIHNRHAALPRRFSTRDLRQRKERWHRANLASTRFYVAPRLKKNRYVQLRFVVQAQQRGRRISCCVLRSRAKITLSWPNVSNLSASRTHMILGPRLPILEINLQRKASNEAWQLIHRGESG